MRAMEGGGEEPARGDAIVTPCPAGSHAGFQQRPAGRATPARLGSSRTKAKQSGLAISFFSGQVLSQWCDCPAFSVLDIGIYVQFYLCFYFIFFYKKEKNIVIKKKKGETVVFHSLG